MKNKSPFENLIKFLHPSDAKKMARKRFVKILMSRGCSRNEANEIAKLARDSGLSYLAYRNSVLVICVQGTSSMPYLCAAMNFKIKVECFDYEKPIAEDL